MSALKILAKIKNSQQWENPNVHYRTILRVAPVVCFAELVSTGVWGIWAEQNARNYTRFLPIPARKEPKIPKLKGS